MAIAESPSPVAVDRCPMCGAEHFRLAISEPPYEIRRCQACGMGWTSPRLDERGLAGIYQADRYWSSESPKTQGYADYAGDQELYLDTFRKRLRYVLRDGPHGGRSLDVGAAAGFCMAAARELGFEVHGVELSPRMAAHARDRLGLESIHVGTLDAAPFPDAHFDLITMWDVIEHLVDPGALLRRARELLAPGGLLVVETQDIDSRFARAAGAAWHHFKHAEHILHFTPSTARRLLEDSGFRVEELTHRYGGKYVAPSFIAERAGRIHPALSRLLAPLDRLQGRRLYLNFMDEMVLRARAA
jgi:2-polyprenyl-3-methyl-5-hydroxy-6-metoxy-1,4-benzoquinol methylase